MTKLNVTKRDGSIEEMDLNKIHSVLFWATEGITNVSVSDIEMKAKIQFVNNISTEKIHNTLIKAAADLITEKTPNYQYVAARLMVFDLRKKVLGQFEPKPVRELVQANMDRGLYDKDLLTWFSDEEWSQFDKIIKHDRDMTFTYAAMKQLVGKYLIQDRESGDIYEPPQYLYLLVAATMYHNFPKREMRMQLIKEAYDQFSQFEVSLPTPIMAGVRSPIRQYASCVLIDPADSLTGISAGTSSIVEYISRKAGIGINGGRIRGEGSKIGGGHAVHTGVVPFYRLWQSAVKSCSQGGVRGGAATLNVPLWHQEICDILVLKNNKGSEDNRVRRIDYVIQFCGLMYERYIEDGVITLFSPHDVTDLYEAFFTDQDEFRRLYVKYEKDTSIKKKTIKARLLFSQFLTERVETGRVYFMNVDHVNDHGSFSVPVYMTNLCVEITLPTKPLKTVDDPEAEIALCILAAINMGNVKDLSELESRCRTAVWMLDELIDLQEYPIEAAERSTRKRRSLGVGVINLAYYLAKNGTKYSDSAALRLLHEFFEAFQYYLIKASVELAKIKGPCEGFKDTKYAKGILPIDTYKKAIDEVCDPTLLLDWESLREDVLKYGMRNSTLSALMPAETSAQISNATNGIEPPRSLVSVKGSKQSAARQVVPEIGKLKNQYECLFDMPSTDGYIMAVGVMQKFVDQSISGNTSYNPEHFNVNDPETGKSKIPMSVLVEDLFKCYRFGWKTGYYNNVFDNRDEKTTTNLPQPIKENAPNDIFDLLNSDSQSLDFSKHLSQTEIVDDEDCDSCKI